MVAVKAANKWLEVATLVLPTHNDDPESLKEMAGWIAKNLGPDTPWHLERFAPMYKLTDLPQTPQTTLEIGPQNRFRRGPEIRVHLKPGARMKAITPIAPPAKKR